MSQFRKFLGWSLVLAAAVWLAPTATRAADATKASVPMPKIEVEPLSRDMGTVAKGDRINVTFAVKNTGNADLVISDARPSCGCTVASFDRVIKPGQSGKIDASVDTKDFSGPITKVVSVISNDPQSPQVNLTIKAIVKPYVDVVPTDFVRFAAVQGDTATQSVDLISQEKSFSPSVEASSQPYVTARVEPVAEKDRPPKSTGIQYKLNVTLGPSAPVGILNAPVKIKTGIAQQPEIEIRVSGIVRDQISVTPLAITFGNFTPGKDVIARNIIINNNKPAQPVRLTKAEVSVSGLTAEIVPVTEGMAYTVIIKPEEHLKKGPFNGIVKIYTDDQQRPEIDVPFSGTAL